MRTKRVNRYYCEFCGKGGCAAGHMAKHERRCTLNPERECGMCELSGNQQPDTRAFVAMLPDPNHYQVDDSLGFTLYQGLEEAIAKIMSDLYLATDGCPTCVFAAIRQRGIPVSSSGFDYTKECRDFWSDYNDAQRSTY